MRERAVVFTQRGGSPSARCEDPPSSLPQNTSESLHLSAMAARGGAGGELERGWQGGRNTCWTGARVEAGRDMRRGARDAQ